VRSSHVSPALDVVRSYRAQHAHAGAEAAAPRAPARKTQLQVPVSTPDSFADEEYYGIDAFVLVSKDGRKQAVRYALVPEKRVRLTPAEAGQKADVRDRAWVAIIADQRCSSGRRRLLKQVARRTQDSAATTRDECATSTVALDCGAIGTGSLTASPRIGSLCGFDVSMRDIEACQVLRP